jgi:hypothetical protein
LEGFLSYSSEEKEYTGSIEIALFEYERNGERPLSLKETGLWGENLSLKYKEPWLFSTAWNGLIRGMIDEDSLTQKTLLRTWSFSKNRC